jgi:hypothetical protein
MRIQALARIHALVAMALMLFAVSASAQQREWEKQQLALFQQHAGEPIKQFPMFYLWEWQVLGPQQLAVWATIHDVYLLRVDKACNNLLWTHGLSVTQEMSQKVTEKFDFVVFRNQRCKIEEIRPIDYEAMLKDGYRPPSTAHKDEQGAQASGGT